ncbi:MAG TPA: mechanosensitive ion channel domain-containing protein, partial [Gemmatimonadota bacterium]|nr:mechanosensitive ion channel domain-containing protein [Gemmatimonadota bacterium]
MKIRFAHVTTLVLTLAVGGLTVDDAWGQLSQSQPAQETAADTAWTPQAIAAADVARAAQTTDDQLRRLRTRLEADPAVSDLEERIPDFVAEVEEMARERESADPGKLSRRGLDNLRQRWLNYRNQLDGWASLLDGRLDALEGARTALDSLVRIWEITRQAGRELEYPGAAREQTASVLNAATEVDQQLRQRLDIVVTLQNQVADASIRVNEVLERIDLAETDLQLRLIARDAPPVWRAWPTAEARAAYLEEARAELAEEFGILRRFLVRNQDRLLVHLGVFILLLALMIGLQRRGKAVSEEKESATSYLLSRPVSTALLVALFLNGPIQRDPPAIFRDLVELVALLPILRLLPRMLPQELRRPLYGLALLFFLNWLGDLMPEFSLAGRLLLALVSLFALIGAVLLLRGSRPAEVGASTAWLTAVRTFLRLAAGALLVAFFANLLGYLALAQFLTGSVLLLAFMAVALFALDRVLEGLIPLLMRTRVGQAINLVRRHSELVARRAVTLVRVGVVALWFHWALAVLGLWRHVVTAVRAMLYQPLAVGSISISLRDIVAFVVALWVAILASRVTRLVLEEDVMPRVDLPRGVPGAISKIVHYGIIAVGIFVAIAAAGLDLSRLTIIIGALGVGIGFGLQNVVNNFISGLILVFERPVQEGDTIQLAALMGEVKRIGIRSST